MNQYDTRRLPAVAIDGPAGAGKSTVARRTAQALGYTYVDTGAMYRAVAWAARDAGIPLDDGEAISRLAAQMQIELRTDGLDTRVFADGREITDAVRTPEISRLVSPISAIPGVRARMTAMQRELGHAGGVVMEGRDIGTVVLPEAEVKVFLTASTAERARRRQAELAARGIQQAHETVEQEIAARDARDSGREIAPLRPAPGAEILDSDRLTPDEVVAAILELHARAARQAVPCG